MYDQSSQDIWQSCCQAIKTAVSSSKIPKNQVKGIGFDATCSLVILDQEGKPIGPTDTDKNVIMWYSILI